MRNSGPARMLAAACAALVLAAVVPAGATAQNDQAALERARTKIRVVEAELQQAQGQQHGAAGALAQAERRLRRLEDAVNEAAAALDRQELAVAEAEHELELLRAQMTRQLDAFSTRAADLYKRGVGAQFAAVFDAGSMADALERSAYVQALNTSDQANLEAITATRTTVDAERARLERERRRLARMQTEQQQLMAKAARLRRHRSLEFAAARANVDALRTQREDLEEESLRIARLIRERQRAAAAAAARARRAARRHPHRNASLLSRLRSSAESRSGAIGTSGYAWPRCDSVTSEYGYRWGRMHSGLDIDGATGDPIYASKSGVVIFTGWSGGYGRLTLVDHGDGVVTGYAHQTSIGVGDGEHVSRGQRIGSVGSTGNSTGSHLHFETRVNGEPVNPRRFLSGSC